MKKLAIVAALLLVAFTACKKDETVVSDFTMSINRDEVSVYNNSMNAEVCLWEWGDGKSSSQYHPVYHAYSEPGEYTITLTAQGRDGSIDYKSKTFTLSW